jgi:hypothetical protein
MEFLKCMLSLLFIGLMVTDSQAFGQTFPDCQGYKPPPELKGKKAVQTTFTGPGGSLVIIHIGHKIFCESIVEGKPPAAERRQAELQVQTGKYHKPSPEDFSVGYAGMGDCSDLYYDCYDQSSPNYGDPQPCAEYAARCR